MFDLFRSRERSVRYLLGALLLLVAASMVITLVPGYGTGWAGPKDPSILAEVGDYRITVQDVRKVLQRQLRNNIPREMASALVPEIVQQMVASRATAIQAERLGLRVTDADVANAVKDIFPQLWAGGKFAGKEFYAQVLASENMTIPEFEELVRTQLLQSRLETLAMEGVIVTPQEVEEAFRRQNESIRLQTVAVTPALVRNRITVSDAELAEHFEKNRAAYRIPEKRSLLIFPISEEQLAASIQVPEEQLRAMYQQQQDRFRTQERVRARHILIKTIDRPASEVPALEKKARDLLRQLKAGADFAELARKNSEDPGSASKGGELDWITRGQTVPEFEKAAFSLKPKEISDVVRTQYGFHIIQVLEHEQARLKPFEEVRAELAAEARRAQVYERMQRLADQIRSALVRSREEAEKIARENGITPVRADNVGPGDPVQEIGVNEQFNAAVKELPVNGVTPVLQIGPNRLVVAQVIAIHPARQAELREVMAQVREAVLSRKAAELADKILADMEARVKAGSANPDQIAREFGLEARTTDFITRSSSIEGIGPAVLAEEAFTKQQGAVVGPIRLTGGGGFIAKVLEKKPADMTQFPARRAAILAELKQQRARDRSDLLRAGIVEELTRRKKIRIYEDNIKRLASAYSTSG